MTTVGHRVAKEILVAARMLVGYEFPSQETLDDYLRQHPKADKSNHWVKSQKPEKHPEKQKTEKKPEKQETEEKSSKSKIEEKTVVPGRFKLPQHKLLKFEAEGDLGTQENVPVQWNP